uniref:Uncharacterized protein n=1 Tax=Setaria viridis TaxID=4556 RepID=A0A4U6W9W0_SETVI|nr:hypothetical protein SEVIR_1G171100v2 [Setaria viridis]
MRQQADRGGRARGPAKSDGSSSADSSKRKPTRRREKPAGGGGNTRGYSLPVPPPRTLHPDRHCDAYAVVLVLVLVLLELACRGRWPAICFPCTSARCLQSAFLSSPVASPSTDAPPVRPPSLGVLGLRSESVPIRRPSESLNPLNHQPNSRSGCQHEQFFLCLHLTLGCWWTASLKVCAVFDNTFFEPSIFHVYF